jgi:hypothetical protein
VDQAVIGPQIRPFAIVDGASAKTVAKISGRSCRVIRSARVAQGLRSAQQVAADRRHDCPPSVVFHTRCEHV